MLLRLLAVVYRLVVQSLRSTDRATSQYERGRGQLVGTRNVAYFVM